MRELCILFLHHADNEVTRQHAGLIQEFNPEAAFVPLTFGKGLGNSIRPHRRLVTDEWQNTDLLVYSWYLSPLRIDARRYLLIEYDTLCTEPFEEFYSGVWDEAVAAAHVVEPQIEPGWYWFRQLKNADVFQGRIMGLSPLSGILLSRQALAAMAGWSRGPEFESLYCECRIGTLARLAGHRPVRIRPDIDRFISWQPRFPDGPGIWHSVKDCL